MPKDEKPVVLDPRGEKEIFANLPISIFLIAGNVHLTLGVERPVAGSAPGPSLKLEREVVTRLVMPEATARRIVAAIQATLQGAALAASPPSAKN